MGYSSRLSDTLAVVEVPIRGSIMYGSLEANPDLESAVVPSDTFAAGLMIEEDARGREVKGEST